MIKLKSRLAKQGHRLYMTKLRKILEPQKNGLFVAIEPDSGDYFLGKTMTEAVEKAKQKHPSKDFFTLKVGSVAVASFKNLASLWP